MYNSREIGIVGKLIITKNVETIIDSLHKKIGASEWSGVLFYKLTKGNIKDLKNLVFETQFIYPMNIGSSTYTEFEYGNEVLNAYDIKEDLINYDTGLSHSHHSMPCFFSGEDTKELLGNCKHYNYYISLIVNFSKDYKCKIAIPSETKVVYKYSFKGTDGKSVNVSRSVEEKTIIVGDLSIEFENKLNIPEWLDTRIINLEEKKKAEKEAKKLPNIKTFSSYPTLNHFKNKYIDNDEWLYGTTTNIPLKVTSKQFLTALILLDDTADISIGLESAILQLLMMEEQDKEEYYLALDNNIEIVHDNLYGNSNKFLEHCKGALLELDMHKQLFAESDYYEIIKENLEIYAAV
jgi:hypothetical protein